MGDKSQEELLQWLVEEGFNEAVVEAFRGML